MLEISSGDFQGRISDRLTAGIGSVSTIFTNMNMSVLLGRELEIKTVLL